MHSGIPVLIGVSLSGHNLPMFIIIFGKNMCFHLLISSFVSQNGPRLTTETTIGGSRCHMRDAAAAACLERFLLVALSAFRLGDKTRQQLLAFSRKL